jgi:hypothetical protein
MDVITWKVTNDDVLLFGETGLQDAILGAHLLSDVYFGLEAMGVPKR